MIQSAIGVGKTTVDSDHVETPNWLKNAIKEEFGTTFDPCPLRAKFDGLSINWQKSNFVNPPFSSKELWMMKAEKEMEKGNTTVMLMPFRLSNYFINRVILNKNVRLRILKNRVKFVGYQRAFPCHVCLVIYPGCEEHKQSSSDNYEYFELECITNKT